MQDEPNRLIREFLDPLRVPTDREIGKILNHVAKAPFRSGRIRVDEDLLVAVFSGRTLDKREPSLTVHLAKRVVVEEQWAIGTTEEQYVADLHSIVDDAELRMVVYRSRDGQCKLGLLAPNRLPRERLGGNSEKLLWVVYSANYGTITTGYQVSSVDRITIPKGARWL